MVILDMPQAREGKFLHFRGKFWCILMLLCRLCESGQTFIIIGFIVIILFIFRSL